MIQIMEENLLNKSPHVTSNLKIVGFLGSTKLQSLFYSIGRLSSSRCLAAHSQFQTLGTEAFFSGTDNASVLQ